MNSLLHLLLKQRGSFSQVIKCELAIPLINLVRDDKCCLFDNLDFKKICKDEETLICKGKEEIISILDDGNGIAPLLNAKFENFDNYSRMQNVYDVIMMRGKKCNLISLKFFIILTELDLVQLMKNFLQHSPEYTCMTEEFRFSQKNLTKLKKELTREYNTFQIQHKMVVYECEIIFLKDLFYLWRNAGEFLLFSKDGSLCVNANNYFEFIYKVIVLYSKGINHVY